MIEIQIRGKLSVGPYLGYQGTAEFDPEAGIFHGEVIGTRDVITFVGSNPEELASAFQDSINDYIELCNELDRVPEKPLSGNFLVRSDPELHRKLSSRAAANDQSLNQYVIGVLKKEVEEPEFSLDSFRTYLAESSEIFEQLTFKALRKDKTLKGFATESTQSDSIIEYPFTDILRLGEQFHTAPTVMRTNRLPPVEEQAFSKVIGH